MKDSGWRFLIFIIIVIMFGKYVLELVWGVVQFIFMSVFVVIVFAIFFGGPTVVGVLAYRMASGIHRSIASTSHMKWNNGVDIVLVLLYTVIGAAIGYLWTLVYPWYYPIYQENLTIVVGILAGLTCFVLGAFLGATTIEKDKSVRR